MGMWVKDGNATYYKEDGRFFNGPDKSIEYDPETRKPIERQAVEVKQPLHETPPIVLGTNRQELEAMTYPQILKQLGIMPQKGMTKAMLIDEILGATE